MPQYRIFTNDRGVSDGVPKYSCLTEIFAWNAKEAQAKYESKYGRGIGHAAVKAIRWPAVGTGLRWLARHV